jgi:hypothetical protein
MMVPSLLIDFLAALMLAVSLYFAGRLLVARTWHRKIHVEVDFAELVMGVAMAGMLRPALNAFPNGLWEVIFTGFALWFVYRNIHFVSRHGLVGGDMIVRYHRLHYPLHILMSFSMLYMYLAGSPVATVHGQMSMAAPTGTTADFVALPLLFAVLLLGFSVWQLDGINRLRPARLVVDARDRNVVTTPPFEPTSAHSANSGSTPLDQTDPLERWQVERWLAPRLETGCLIAMSVTMAFLLILMF